MCILFLRIISNIELSILARARPLAQKANHTHTSAPNRTNHEKWSHDRRQDERKQKNARSRHQINPESTCIRWISYLRMRELESILKEFGLEALRNWESGWSHKNSRATPGMWSRNFSNDQRGEATTAGSPPSLSHESSGFHAWSEN